MAAAAAAAAAPAADPTSVALVVAAAAEPQRAVTYTADHLLTRWQEIDALITSTGALEQHSNVPASHMIEVFTGKAIFISNVLYGMRNGETAAAGSSVAVKTSGTKRQMSLHLRPDMSAPLLQMLRETSAIKAVAACKRRTAWPSPRGGGGGGGSRRMLSK